MPSLILGDAASEKFQEALETPECCGFVKVKKRWGWKKQFFVLKEGFVFCLSKQNAKRPIAILNVKKCEVSRYAKRKKQCTLPSPMLKLLVAKSVDCWSKWSNRVYTLKFANEDDRVKWESIFERYHRGELLIPPPREPEESSSQDEETPTIPPIVEEENPEPIKLHKCLICADRFAGIVFTPCGHFVVCFECSLELMQRELNCPCCRQQIENIVRVYGP